MSKNGDRILVYKKGINQEIINYADKPTKQKEFKRELSKTIRDIIRKGLKKKEIVYIYTDLELEYAKACAKEFGKELVIKAVEENCFKYTEVWMKGE